MIICQLGRQPELSRAELTALYPHRVQSFGPEFALVDTEPEQFDIQRLGGSQKAGVVALELPALAWPEVAAAIHQHYVTDLSHTSGKISLGISAYGLSHRSARDIANLGLALKRDLKPRGVSVRLIPNKSVVLSTASSHHNKLGLSPKKREILVIQQHQRIIVADSIGTQNITAYAKRDQARPARDAYVGMLPPKLAQIMLNLAVGPATTPQHILDPFCGTGVVLQEALLLGHTVYGSDLQPKMIDYTHRNLSWLMQTHRQAQTGTIGSIQPADATTAQWPYAQTVTAVVCEGYLGQPFSAAPSDSKLQSVRRTCNHIMASFLDNIAPQLASGTRLVVAVPAWRQPGESKSLTRLPLTQPPAQNSSYHWHNQSPLLYYRPDQVVARDILVLEKR